LYCGAVAIQVIVLNGGSSAGKSGIARCLQSVMPDPWLTLGTDKLIEAMPILSPTAATGIKFEPDGEVVVKPEFRVVEAAWMAGVAAMARAGTGVILDEVLLSGEAGQQRWNAALAGLSVFWVGVRCDRVIAAAREVARGDRIPGMAVSQAQRVHQGVVYDLEVDTSHTEALECARIIAANALKSG
jgi:chloramphenicol 3-O phosphotransferase